MSPVAFGRGPVASHHVEVIAYVETRGALDDRGLEAISHHVLAFGDQAANMKLAQISRCDGR